MIAYTTPVATYLRCQGCGNAYKGERGLRAHQTQRFVTASCRPR